MSLIIIQGSSRLEGNTHKVVLELQKHLGGEEIPLKEYDISAYDYEHLNQSDDFLPLFQRLLAYDTWIFATPEYWYSMSGIMKNFFDRITDGLTIEKDLGRQLRGKKMAALVCSSGPEETEGFFMPFRASANYLGMDYLGDIHTWVGKVGIPKEVDERLLTFAQQIKLAQFG
ncbi:MAG: NAD(P)H-dependent oxidoreductase [Bacteroidota bacterium]